MRALWEISRIMAHLRLRGCPSFAIEVGEVVTRSIPLGVDGNIGELFWDLAPRIRSVSPLIVSVLVEAIHLIADRLDFTLNLVFGWDTHSVRHSLNLSVAIHRGLIAREWVFLVQLLLFEEALIIHAPVFHLKLLKSSLYLFDQSSVYKTQQ